MTGPSAPESRLTDCEPRKATNWRAVIAAGIVGLLTLMGVAALLHLAPGEPSPKEAPLPPPSRLALIDERRAPPPVMLPEALLAPSAEVAEEIGPPRAPVLLAAVPPPAAAPERIPPPAIVQAETVVAQQAQQPPFSSRFLRRHLLPEADLAEYLRLLAPELSIDTVKDTSKKLHAQAKASPRKEHTAAIQELLAQRADLSGLPLQNEADCQLKDAEAKTMQELSRGFRRGLLRSGRERRPSHPYNYSYESHADLQAAYIENALFSGKEWRQKEAIPTLIQVLQAQDLPTRLVLVNLLAQIEGPAASSALAGRALHDLSPDVREYALRALRTRPQAEYRQVLLDGLRFPLDVVADHAAEALTALGDRGAAPALVKLLDLPDPNEPVRGKDGKLRVAELVRVNHLSRLFSFPRSRESGRSGLVTPRPAAFHFQTAARTGFAGIGAISW